MAFSVTQFSYTTTNTPCINCSYHKDTNTTRNPDKFNHLNMLVSGCLWRFGRINYHLNVVKLNGASIHCLGSSMTGCEYDTIICVPLKLYFQFTLPFMEWSQCAYLLVATQNTFSTSLQVLLLFTIVRHKNTWY